MLNEAEKRQKKFEPADRMAMGLGVRDGARAEYLRKRIDKLSPQSRRAFVEDQFRKGVLTFVVWDQILSSDYRNR
jgi:hypothetical protein